jgi:hypothetical protein
MIIYALLKDHNLVMIDVSSHIVLLLIDSYQTVAVRNVNLDLPLMVFNKIASQMVVVVVHQVAQITLVDKLIVFVEATIVAKDTS